MSNRTYNQIRRQAEKLLEVIGELSTEQQQELLGNVKDFEMCLQSTTPAENVLNTIRKNAHEIYLRGYKEIEFREYLSRWDAIGKIDALKKGVHEYGLSLRRAKVVYCEVFGDF